MTTTRFRKLIASMAAGTALCFGGLAVAGVITEFHFLGKVTESADVVPIGSDIDALLRFETLQTPLSRDVGEGPSANVAITETYTFSSLDVSFNDERFGGPGSGIIVERDGNGGVPDRYSVEGAALGGTGPWITSTITYDAMPDSSVEIPLPEFLRAAAALTGPWVTDTLSFQGLIGDFALGLSNGLVLRGQITRVTGGAASPIAEPMTLLLCAAGFSAVGVLAGHSRRRRAPKEMAAA
jgi:hypothetical protein